MQVFIYMKCIWWMAFLLLLSRFFVFDNLIIMCLSVGLFLFILIEAFCAFSIWMSSYYLGFGNFSVFLIFSHYFLKSVLCSTLSCPSRTFIIFTLLCLMVSQKSFCHSLWMKSFTWFFLAPSDSLISYHLSYSSLILSSD